MKPKAEPPKEVSLNRLCLGVELDIRLVLTCRAVSSFNSFESL